MYRNAFRDIWFGIVVSIVFLILSFTPLESLLQNQASTLVVPLQYGFSVVGQRIQGQISFLQAVVSLQERNTYLEAEAVQLKGEIALLEEVERENKLLREQLGTSIADEYEQELAKVIGRGVHESSAIIKIDKGSKDGIRQGAVVTIGPHLAGVVTDDIDLYHSFVRLVTDSELRVAVLDQDSPDRSKGIVRGQYSTVMVMEKIFHDEIIVEGDTIITSGEDGVFPKGLLIGTVEKVLSEEGEGVLKKAQITPLVDITGAGEVFVLHEKGVEK